MPARPIYKHNDVNIRLNFSTDAIQKQIHNSCVDTVKDKRKLVSIFWVYRSNEICTLESILSNDLRTVPLNSPKLCYDTFLAEPRFVLEPELDFFLLVD